MTQVQRDDLTTLFKRIRDNTDGILARAICDGNKAREHEARELREDIEILSIVVGAAIGREPQIGHDHPWHGSRAYDRSADLSLHGHEGRRGTEAAIKVRPEAGDDPF